MIQHKKNIIIQHYSNITAYNTDDLSGSEKISENDISK